MFFALKATHIRIFLLSFVLLINTVSLESVSVVGAAGGSVLLPCQIRDNPRYVYWRHKDSINVCDLVGAGADFTAQDSAFKGRVSIFLSDSRDGNFSIHLDKVSKSDEGLYTCSAPTVRYKQYLQLTVTEQENKEEEQEIKKKSRLAVKRPTSAPSSGPAARRVDGLFTLLLGSALLYSMT